MGKVKATTMVETLTAMVLITIAFGIAIMVYVNTIAHTPTVIQQKAALILEEVATLTKQEERYITEDFEYKHFIISRMVKPYAQKTNVYELQLIAKNRDETVLANYQELLYLPK